MNMTGVDAFKDNGGNVVADRVTALTEQARSLVDENFDFHLRLASDLAILEGPESDLWARLTESVCSDENSIGKAHELGKIASPLTIVGGREQAVQLAELVDTPVDKAVILTRVAEREGPESELWSGIVDALATVDHPEVSYPIYAERDQEFLTIGRKVDEIVSRASNVSADVALQLFRALKEKPNLLINPIVVKSVYNAQLGAGRVEDALEVAQILKAAQGFLGVKQHRTDLSREVNCYMVLGREADAQAVVDEAFPADAKDPRRYAVLAEIESIRQANNDNVMDLSAYWRLAEAARAAEEPEYAIYRIAGTLALLGQFDEAKRFYEEALRTEGRYEYKSAAYEAEELFRAHAVKEGNYEEALRWEDFNLDDDSREISVREQLGLQAARTGDITAAMEQVDRLVALDDEEFNFTVPIQVYAIAAEVLRTTGNLGTALDMVAKNPRDDMRLIYSLKTAAAHKLLQTI